eukprot:2832229-Rhodomonas_salina.1
MELLDLFLLLSGASFSRPQYRTSRNKVPVAAHFSVPHTTSPVRSRQERKLSAQTARGMCFAAFDLRVWMLPLRLRHPLLN